jgi:hypothetical protein
MPKGEQETPEEVNQRLKREGDQRGESEWCSLGNCALCTDGPPGPCTCVCHQ